MFLKANEHSIDIPADAIRLLEKLFELDPNRRISSEDAIKHPFCLKYHDEQDEPTCEPFIETFESKELSNREWKSKHFDLKFTQEYRIHKWNLFFFLGKTFEEVINFVEPSEKTLAIIYKNEYLD